MKLKPFDSRWTAIVAGWLNEEDNWKWLQFGFGTQIGCGTQKLDPLTFRLMAQNPEHDFHLFYDDLQNQPIGLVAFSEIDQTAKTARLWFVLGDKKYARRGYTKKAVNECLRYAFFDLGLQSIHTSTVKENDASINILEECKFNFVGRRRQCQPINGTLRDQLLYDLLAVEFLEDDMHKYQSVLWLDDKRRTKKHAVKTVVGSL